MDRLSELPEPILHRILYFLVKKEAKRTCILSKSWRYIWSNRHRLSLKEQRRSNFLFQANNTLQSLLDQNHQGVQKFLLTIRTVDSQSIAFLQKWIPMLTAMSIKHLYLHICNKEKEEDVDLPFQAFAAKSLRTLHLCRCNLFRDHYEITKIPFQHHLTKIVLRHVCIQEVDGKGIIDKIISGCRSLTTMRFDQCKGLRRVEIKQKFHKKLMHFTFISHLSYRARDCSIKIDHPTIETIKITGSKVRFRNHEYSKLKSLSLETVRTSFDNSSFPSLQELTLIYYGGGLSCINAPNIVKFKYLGTSIPLISFKETSGKWRSDITLHLAGNDFQSWLLKLSEFLHSLRMSKITLRIMNLDIQGDPNIDIGGSNEPVVVEKLQLGGNVPCFPALLDGLFRICRPRYISQNWYFEARNEMMRMEQKELVEFLCPILMNTNQQEEEIGQHYDHLPRGVKIQSFDCDQRQWRFIKQKSLTQFTSINSQTFRRIRFLLKWKPRRRNQAASSSSPE